jgi:hypothetical protein
MYVTFYWFYSIISSLSWHELQVRANLIAHKNPLA